MSYQPVLSRLGFTNAELLGGALAVVTPIDGTTVASLRTHTAADVEVKIDQANAAFGVWRLVPAPRRGELVRLFGEELRDAKADLGALVTLESGKILQEGFGEVQEMIDICDFAVGLSRQLYGLTIASERPGHSMRETWHPAGVCGVITAFNFPVAPWCWNAALAFVCGDPVIWKPSEKAPLSALATQKIFARAMKRFGDVPPALSQVIVGAADASTVLVASPGVPIISATGSTRMGRAVGPIVAARFGRSILELGGNNAMIVAPSADLDLALRAIVFSAVGTAGQRCTSLRRLIVHNAVYDALVPRLKAIYRGLAIGDPFDAHTLVGPLIAASAFRAMQDALAAARTQGGVVSGGGRVLQSLHSDAYYVQPAIVEMSQQTDIVREETFAPILYVMKYDDFDQAISMHNDVPQGLSSCIFSTDVRETETFLSVVGSDCGIANVNIGPSGAEIGGAFGGEKDSGGGRESGSDAWKAYMRRQTNTVNYSHALPLAQGIKFDL